MKITLTIEIELPERLENIDPVDYEGFKVKVKETKPEVKKEPEPAKITKEIPLPENHEKDHSEPTQLIKCPICEKLFAKDRTKKFCSDECRAINFQEKNREYHKRWAEKHKKESEPKKMPVTLHGPTTKPAGVTGIIDTSKQPERIKPEPAGRKTVILKSGERLCQHCKEPFKIEKFEQHFCSDSCEVLHRKNHKEPAMV